MRLQRLDPKGAMRIGAHGLGHRRAGRIAQELDVLGMLARIGGPSSGFGPIRSAPSADGVTTCLLASTTEVLRFALRSRPSCR
jgi:hypothetical protein